MARLTRLQMEQEIKRGRSVLHNGNFITRVEDLPKNDELAETPEAKAKAAEDIRAEIAALNARLAKVEGDATAKAKAEADAKAKADAEAKAKAALEAAAKAKAEADAKANKTEAK